MDGDKGSTYKRAGVDIDAANRSVEMIKKWVDRTKRPEVLEGIGAFGGFLLSTTANTGNRFSFQEPTG